MKNTKRLLALLLALCLSMGLALPAGASWFEKPAPFEDLSEWPYKWPVSCDFISRALELGIFAGTSSATFSPREPITRAQAVTALAKTHQAITGEAVSASGSAPFSDVPAGSWYGRYVNWAYEIGLVSGTGKGKFSPGRLVSYAELGVMFHRYLETQGLDTLYKPVPGDWSSFPFWAREHLEAISGFEIFSTAYMESPTVERGNAARWFVRLYEKATFPVDKETERVKYVYNVPLPYVQPEPGLDNDLDDSCSGFERKEASILTSYEEYARLLADRQQYASLFEKVPQPRERAIWEGGFEQYNLLAVETAYGSSPAYDCELGAFSIEGDGAKITLVEDGLYGSTADLKGALFFIWVPKDVTQGEITSMSWTEISHWDLG